MNTDPFETMRARDPRLLVVAIVPVRHGLEVRPVAGTLMDTHHPTESLNDQFNRAQEAIRATIEGTEGHVALYLVPSGWLLAPSMLQMSNADLAVSITFRAEPFYATPDAVGDA
jgi:hypothetical protein